jgi:hypothetical protein
MQNEKILPFTNDKFQIGIFPNYFKRIGIGILILFFIPALIFKLLDVSFYTQNKILYRELATCVLIMGLFFIAWSKEKSENNHIHLLRYKALAIAFFFAVFIGLLTPLTDLLFGKSVEDAKPTNVILNMLMIYLVFFYLSKRARPGETNT